MNFIFFLLNSYAVLPEICENFTQEGKEVLTYLVKKDLNLFKNEEFVYFVNNNEKFKKSNVVLSGNMSKTNTAVNKLILELPGCDYLEQLKTNLILLKNRKFFVDFEYFFILKGICNYYKTEFDCNFKFDEKTQTEMNKDFHNINKDLKFYCFLFLDLIFIGLILIIKF